MFGDYTMTASAYKEHGIFKRMIVRLHRRWWLLRGLRDECRKTAINQLSVKQLHFNAKGSVAREAFVGQMANKSLERFSGILFWRKKYNEKKKKRRLPEYNSIFDEMIREGLIYEEEDNSFKDDNGNSLNPPGRPFFRTTDLGDKYIAEFWYQIYLNNYYAKTIIVGVVTAIVVAIATS